MEYAYQLVKAHLLASDAQVNLPVVGMDAQLRAASALRRALEQSAKAARLLATPLPASKYYWIVLSSR